MASSSYVIQQLMPALASSLAKLRRTPGRNEGWLEEGLPALERTDATRHDRMRRRIGFARRLGDLTGLHADDTATLTLGLFFYEMVEGQPARSRGASSSVWLEYLLRNEDWLAPAFEVCEKIGSEEWPTGNSKPATVAKMTVVFDIATLERHERPLQVLQELMSEIDSRVAGEVITLLWSEEGQELCDHHFRRHPQGYKLEAGELRSCFEALRKLAPAPPAEDTVAPPLQLSSSMPRPTGEAPKEPAPATRAGQRPRAPGQRPAAPMSAGANFDRRREALRARQPFGLPEVTYSSPPQQDHGGGSADEPLTAEMLASEEPGPRERYDEEPERDDDARAMRGGKPMEQSRTISPVPPGRRDALDMMQKLQDVRLQLGQIQRIAVDAEQLLTGLAPQLDELAAWVADLDAIVRRWQGRENIERAA